ncbi:hypothetical protein [Anaerobium acetethylicum]|uniref:Uncharacterized protein n=1 Tax=Anaerobium acetethylicum TaxID=1619234 RepID=A0A1D3TPL3_9FIRM|nr:hypothetical protein [Anaerobium acetethylicum]SCP95347.1 hypothetical protein SAMN05421730_1001495 [Anaerobium acetethylicum]
MGYVIKLGKYAIEKGFSESELRDQDFGTGEPGECWKLEGKDAKRALDYIKAEFNLVAEYDEDSDALQLYDAPDERWFGEKIGLIKAEIKSFEKEGGSSCKAFEAIQEIMLPRYDIFVLYEECLDDVDTFFATKAENEALYYILDVAEF